MYVFAFLEEMGNNETYHDRVANGTNLRNKYQVKHSRSVTNALLHTREAIQ